MMSAFAYNQNIDINCLLSTPSPCRQVSCPGFSEVCLRLYGKCLRWLCSTVGRQRYL